MKKIGYVFVGILAVLTIFITTASAFEGSGTEVMFTDDGDTTRFITRVDYVGDFLEEIGIELHEFDKITPALDTEIDGSMEIEILRAFPVYVKLDDAQELQVFYARPGSFLFTFVNDLRAQTELDYIFDRDNWNMSLSPGDVIELTSIRRFVRNTFLGVAYENYYFKNDEIFFGDTEIYHAGVPGIRQVTTMSVYIGGRPYGHSVLKDEVLLQPVNAIVHLGTYLPQYHALSACGQVFRYVRSLRMEATAYTLSFECTGRHPGHPLFGVTASGMMAQVGVVAVDTNVIPFHTRMYIEGYGFAVAGDRGGAIRGYKVDLFFDTREEVRQFGRRHLQVWILD